MHDPVTLKRHAPSQGATLARINRRPAAHPGTAARAGRREFGLRVRTHGIIAAAVSDVALHAVTVLLADEVGRDSRERA